MTILISPWSRPLRNGQENSKNYPFWCELITLVDHPIEQVGVRGETQLVDTMHVDLNLDRLARLIQDSITWISVDSFFQHYCWHLNKTGIVLWGQSDPNIFGHSSNVNLLKNSSYLRQHQFFLWEQAEYRTDCWVEPQEVAAALNHLLGGNQ